MEMVRKADWPLVAALAMAGGLVVLGPPVAAPAAEGTRVQMVDNEPDLTNWHFDPAEVTVPAGATVVWLNKGKEDHTVTADDGSFDSGMKRTGATFQRAFPKAGSYAYHCAPHPWMKGTVRVVGTATAAAAPAGTEATAAPVSTTGDDGGTDGHDVPGVAGGADAAGGGRGRDHDLGAGAGPRRRPRRGRRKRPRPRRPPAGRARGGTCRGRSPSCCSPRWPGWPSERSCGSRSRKRRSPRSPGGAIAGKLVPI